MKIDTVGSFLPPQYLVHARNESVQGKIDNTALRNIENRAITELIERQIKAGLSEVTSGELRRTHWDKDFYFGLEGLSKANFDSGRIYPNAETATDLLRITGRISYNPRHPFLEDFKFLKSTTSSETICRQTLPSPANLYLELLAMTDGHPGLIYPSAESLLDDISDAYRETIMELYRLGCRSIQFDDTACGLLCQDNFTKRLLQGGTDLLAIHEQIISLINTSLAGLPADLKTSLYLSGGDIIIPEWEYIEYPDNIMPKILRDAAVDKFFMPFSLDDEYPFEILRHIPANKHVVLGLIDAHSPFFEEKAQLYKALEFARKHIESANISISPRTGFKLSTYLHRGLTYEDQWNKLSHLSTL